MRNIFLFIRRYFTFLSFLVLQFIALSILFKYNKHHRAVFLGKANEMTGYFNTRYDRLDDYFHLKEENERLHRMNDSLLSTLPINFSKLDTGSTIVRDTTWRDSTAVIKVYEWREAKVVSNSVIQQNNYIQIDRGAKYGIRDKMAVLNSDGSAVGMVINVSDNYSQIMSLLHRQSKVSVTMKKSGNTGTIEWEGRSPLELTLRNIPKSDSVRVGDSVITSIHSGFPPGFIVGTVSALVDDKTTNFYVLKVRPAANFQNLQRVHVIENLQREEQARLDKDTKKRMDEINKKKQ